MPQGFGAPVSTEFAYISVDDLRAEGFTEAMLPSDRAKELIYYCSNWINWLTKQWFAPVRLIQKVDPRHSAMMHLPSFVPILDFFNLQVGRADLFITSLPPISYAVKPRYVQMLSRSAHLTSVPMFAILDGVFGWQEDDFAPVTVQLTAAMNAGDTQLKVSGANGIFAGDNILVGTQPYPQSISVLVKGVDQSGIIECDPVKISLPVGTNAVRYGRTPRMIQYAVKLLVKDMTVVLGAQDGPDDPNTPGWFYRRLQNESVEGYSYGLAPLPVAYGPGGGAFTSGNPQVDDICQMYAMPILYFGNTG